MANENETVEQVHTDVFGRIRVASSLDEDSMIHNSAVADLLANIDARYVAAYKRELAARDAEIARLKDKISWLSFRVDNRNGIIKELADKLADLLACDGVYRDGADCYKKCREESREMCGRGKTCQLVAKAREAFNA